MERRSVHEKTGSSVVERRSGPVRFRVRSRIGEEGGKGQFLRQYHRGGADHGRVYRRQGGKRSLRAHLHHQVSRDRDDGVRGRQAGSRPAPGSASDPAGAEGEGCARRVQVARRRGLPRLGEAGRHHRPVRHRVCRLDLQQEPGQSRGRPHGLQGSGQPEMARQDRHAGSLLARHHHLLARGSEGSRDLRERQGVDGFPQGARGQQADVRQFLQPHSGPRGKRGEARCDLHAKVHHHPPAGAARLGQDRRPARHAAGAWRSRPRRPTPTPPDCSWITGCRGTP